MQQDIHVSFYKFRFLLAGIVATALLVAISATVTAVGSGSVLDTRSGASATISDMGMSSDSPNAVTASAYTLMEGTKRITLASGTALYGGCRGITNGATQVAGAALHGSAVIVHGVWSGMAFVGRGIGNGIMFTFHTAASGIMFTLHLPHTLLGSVASGQAVSSIIRPADEKSVPVIKNQPSPAVLASLSAPGQTDIHDPQDIADLWVAQYIANKGLGGSLVAGDSAHGGYPAKWDEPVAQDSLVDSWGMYNRECVSYAAWKVFQTYGYMPYWGGVGNANQWVHDAKAAGIPTGGTPQPRSVAISMRGYYGHAMWVEAVSGDMVYVSQYNYDLHGHYSEMWVNSSYFTYIYFK